MVCAIGCVIFCDFAGTLCPCLPSPCHPTFVASLRAVSNAYMFLPTDHMPAHRALLTRESKFSTGFVLPPAKWAGPLPGRGGMRRQGAGGHGGRRAAPLRGSRRHLLAPFALLRNKINAGTMRPTAAHKVGAGPRAPGQGPPGA